MSERVLGMGKCPHCGAELQVKTEEVDLRAALYDAICLVGGGGEEGLKKFVADLVENDPIGAFRVFAELEEER